MFHQNILHPENIVNSHILSELGDKISLLQTHINNELSKLTKNDIQLFSAIFNSTPHELIKMLRFIRSSCDPFSKLSVEMILDILVRAPFRDLIAFGRTSIFVLLIFREPIFWTVRLRYDYHIRAIISDQPAKVYLQIRILLEKMGKISNNLLLEAIDNRMPELAVVLIRDPRIDPSEQNDQALIRASTLGHSKVVDHLLQDFRVDPSSRDNEALIRASSRGHLKIVNRLLQDFRVHPSSRDNEALKLAYREGHLDTVEVLLNDFRIRFTYLDTLKILLDRSYQNLIKIGE